MIFIHSNKSCNLSRQLYTIDRGVESCRRTLVAMRDNYTTNSELVPLGIWPLDAGSARNKHIRDILVSTPNEMK